MAWNLSFSRWMFPNYNLSLTWTSWVRFGLQVWGITTNCVENINNLDIQILYLKIRNIPLWPSRVMVNTNTPNCFKILYPTTRFNESGCHWGTNRIAKLNFSHIAIYTNVQETNIYLGNENAFDGRYICSKKAAYHGL